MIAVTCGACGASFRAKDEHAGKRGKCPSCSAPLTIGAATTAASTTPTPTAASGSPAPAAAGKTPTPAAAGKTPAPAAASKTPAPARAAAAHASPAAPTVVAPVAGGGRRSSRPSRASSGRAAKDFTRLGLVLGVVALVLSAGAWYFFQTGEQDHLALGIELLEKGELAAAAAHFEQVAADTRGHASAQEYLAEVRQLMQAEVVRADVGRAENVYAIVKALEKRVSRDGKGHLEPDYKNQARYLLKRAREFLETWPEHPRAVEVKQIAYRFSDVASLETPPSSADVEAELSQRLIMINPNFPAAMAAVDELAAQGGNEAARAEELRADVRAASVEYWGLIKGRMQEDGLLEPGKENWQRVASQALRYLEAVKDVPGLTELPEARALFERALAGG